MSTSQLPARRLGAIRVGRPRATASARSIPADVWVLGALIIVAAVIRIITINNQSFWQDEALTAYEAHLPFGAMINTVAHVETTPPLYFILVWVWGHIFGTGEVALRSISTIAGIALVPIAYLATRELTTRWAGVLAAAFVTVNPFLIWFSQEARSYMLLAAFSGASFLFFARSLRDPSRRNLIWWAVFAALAVMTHFFGGFIAVPEALGLLWSARSRLAVICVGAVAVVQLAMLPLAVTDTGHGPGWVAGTPQATRVAKTVLEWAVSLLLRRGTVAGGLIGGAALIALVSTLLAFGGDRRLKRGAGIAAAIAAFVFIVPLTLRVIGQDYFFSRNEIPAVVPLATVLAAACVVPRARVMGGLLAVGLLAMFSVAAIVVQTTPHLLRPDWRRVAQALGPAEVPRAILAADGTTADPLKIYLPHVNWVQQHNRRVLVQEIDVVGATKALVLRPSAAAALTGAIPPRTRRASSLPRRVAPRGAALISRFRVSSWVIARFALRRPERLSINQLLALAPQYFIHTPNSMLVFDQGRAP